MPLESLLETLRAQGRLSYAARFVEALYAGRPIWIVEIAPRTSVRLIFRR